MDLLNIITILISVIAIGIAAYALASINRSQRRVITAKEADVGPARSESRRIQAPGVDIAVSGNWLGGAGTVELMRRKRFDVFDIPGDFFDLDTIDEDAANYLTAVLVAPSTVQPHRSFDILWKVTGPTKAFDRVNSFQLNLMPCGPVFHYPEFTTDVTQDGVTALATLRPSIWQDSMVQLWAHFNSGIRKFPVVADVKVDFSDCTEKRLPLGFLTIILQGAAADKFIANVQEEAGNDVTVRVVTDAIATVSSDGFTFHMVIELDALLGTVTVGLGMQFMIAPRADGSLGAFFSPPGYIVVDPDLPWYYDFWQKITVGVSYRHKFNVGLERLANGFASAAIGRPVRGLPEIVGNELRQWPEAPKAVATAIDMDSEEIIVTLCGGGPPADTIKLDP